MSTFEVPVLRLDTIEPHPNADKLELAVVGGYRAVVGKGDHQVGDRVVYIPTDALVPIELADTLNIRTYLAGKSKQRVKAVKLRGVLSEGIVVPLARIIPFLPPSVYDLTGEVADCDLAEALGIVKYEEQIPASMQGQARNWPAFLTKYDVENLKSRTHARLIEPGEQVFVTEKLHGTNITVALEATAQDEYEVYVCSRNHALLPARTDEDTDVLTQPYASQPNVYWRAALKYELPQKLAQIITAAHEAGVGQINTLSLHGEVIGVQDLKYGFDNVEPGFAAFDIKINGEYLHAGDFFKLCQQYDIPHVPLLFIGEFDQDFLLDMAERPSAIDGGIREGVVVVTAEERYEHRGGRCKLKLVGGNYLTRKGVTTELH